MNDDQIINLVQSIIDGEELRPGLMATILARATLHFAQIAMRDDESVIGSVAEMAECASQLMQDITQDANGQLETLAPEYVR